MLFKNQVPSYDVVRPNYIGRYVVYDRYLTGKPRFGLCEGESECVFKSAVMAKTSEYTSYGSLTINIDREIVGICVDSYIVINNKFYLVTKYTNKYNAYSIEISSGLEDNLEENTEVILYSIPITTSYDDAKCTMIEFGVGLISINNIEYEITESDTIDSVMDYYKEKIPVTNFGTTLYFYGSGYSENTKYFMYDYIPTEAKMVMIETNSSLCKGDDLVMFNESVMANFETTINEIYEISVSVGRKYIACLSSLDNKYSYAQLLANPAYFSRKINFGNIRPCIADVCNGTVFGENGKAIFGIKLYNKDEELSKIYSEETLISNLVTSPSDLFLNKVVYGTIIPKLPNLTFVCNDDGIFQMVIESPITDKFLFCFSSTSECQVSFMKLETSEILANETAKDNIEVEIDNVVMTLKSIPKAQITLTTFSNTKILANSFKYYFLLKEGNKTRMEANSIHLNPLFKNYRELLAIIGTHKAGEGKVAL